MRSAWIALALLISYLLLVFITFRFLDFLLWYQNGATRTELVNPLLLGVRQLKQLLDIRGVSYTGYIEKQELVHLVQASADVVRGEVDELDEVNSIDKGRISYSPPISAQFSGAAHFYEQVEDTKDSVWLLQLIPTSHIDPLLDDYTWTVVRNMVEPFAIRTGIFNCRLDHKLCNNKGWTQPLLLLAMPRGIKPKDQVVMRTCQLTKPNAILEWLREHLSLRVHQVSGYDELNYTWLQTTNKSLSPIENNKNNNIGIKVLLLTHLLHPPLFLAALSIKFTGRITFGIFTVKKEDSIKIGTIPRYLVITSDKTVVYGRRQMEHFNFRSMNVFLRSIQPEMNDFFICSLVLVNMFAVLYFLQDCAYSWWRILAATFWTIIVCNLLLFALWLLLYGTLRWPSTYSLCNWCLRIVRLIVLSDTGSLIRSDWIRLLNSSWIFFTSLFIFGIIVCRKVPQYNNETDTSWWEIDWLFSRPQLGRVVVDTETGVLIERLAVPALWLQPPLSYEYARLLPIHKYRPKERKIFKRDSTELSTITSRPHEITEQSTNLLFDSTNITECAICLVKYKSGVLLCTLPCSHNYHHRCIDTWLSRDNHHCPICRWPAYKNKI